MPNRILKESICTSPTIDQLEPMEEVFFYRLLVACDDYGRFDARPPILRARCFPLRLDLTTDADLRHWLSRLQAVGLLQVYSVEGQPYLQLTTWDRHQQVRAKRSKFPAPDCADADSASICNQLISGASTCPRNPNPIQSESNPNHVVTPDPPKFDADSEPFKIALHLREKIVEHSPRARLPKPTPEGMAGWSEDADKLLRIDKRPPDEIRAVIDWCQADTFWRANILCVSKLREKYDQLDLQRRAPPRRNGHAPPPKPAPTTHFMDGGIVFDLDKLNAEWEKEKAEEAARAIN